MEGRLLVDTHLVAQEDVAPSATLLEWLPMPCRARKVTDTPPEFGRLGGRIEAGGWDWKLRLRVKEPDLRVLQVRNAVTRTPRPEQVLAVIEEEDLQRFA